MTESPLTRPPASPQASLSRTTHHQPHPPLSFLQGHPPLNGHITYMPALNKVSGESLPCPLFQTPQKVGNRLHSRHFLQETKSADFPLWFSCPSCPAWCNASTLCPCIILGSMLWHIDPGIQDPGSILWLLEVRAP